MAINRSATHYTGNYYQAVAERSRALAPPLHHPCITLHPSRLRLVAPLAMSQIAPFNRAGRALPTGDATSRLTNGAAGAGLQRALPMQHVHQAAPLTTADRNHTTPRRDRMHALGGEVDNFDPSPSDTGRSVVFLHRQFRKSIFSGGATWP